MSVRQPLQYAPAPAGRRRRSAVPAIAASTMLFAFPAVSLAQQWHVAPVVEIAAQYIDNPRLQENGPTDDITGGLLDIGAEFIRNTPTTSVLFRPSAAVYRYASDSNEDSEAYFLDLNADKDGQRSNWRIDADFSRQQVFRGETTSADLDETGVEDDVQTGTGRTFERRERDLFRIRPGFTVDVTERTGLKFDVSYIDTRYESQEFGEAVDYQNSRADASLVRALTPDSNFEFGVFASRYEPDLRPETDARGVRARYEQEVSDISSFFIDVGAQESDIRSIVDPQQEESETSFLWNIGYDRRLERTRWLFNVGQAVTPSGSGALVERDLYRVIMQHQLRPRWEVRLSGALMNTNAVGGEDVTSSLDRDYFQGRATLSYQVTRTWTLEGLYKLTHQDFADISGDAREHEVRISLVYRRPVPTS